MAGCTRGAWRRYRYQKPRPRAPAETQGRGFAVTGPRIIERMSDNGMSRLDALTFTRRVVADQARRQLAQIDAWIAAEQRRITERERAAQTRPQPADWLLEHGLDKRDILSVHTGDCWSGSKSTRTRAITREQAIQSLANGISACTHCRPDTELGLLD